jgi:Flp pilus assembly protein TadD
VAPLQRAAELAPQSPQMQYNLAFTYYRLQRYELARAALQPAVQRWPDLFSVHALYGAVLLELNQIQPAYEALRQAHQLNPQDTMATGSLFRAAMAMAEQQEKTGSLASAVPYLEEAALLAPAEPGPHRRLAAIYRQVGNVDQAREEDHKASNSTNSANQ